MKDSKTLADRLLNISGKIAGGYVSKLPNGQPVIIGRDSPVAYQEIGRRTFDNAWPLSDDERRAVCQADWASLFPGTFRQAKALEMGHH